MSRLSWCRLLMIGHHGGDSLSAACGKTVGEAIDDTTITTRVKTAMLNDPGVGGLRMDVDTFKGVVTLSGRVKSQAEHDQAIALARRVNGVAEVKDALQIIPEGSARAAVVSGASTSILPSLRCVSARPGTPRDRRVATDSLTSADGPQTKQSVLAGSCSTASKCSAPIRPRGPSHDGPSSRVTV